MKRAIHMQEVRKMRFKESYDGWQSGRLTQADAAEILGVCERSFRRYARNYEDGGGLEALSDKRLNQPSRRRAPLEEGVALANMYRAEFADFNVRHFHEKYVKRAGADSARSYSRVKTVLQGAQLLKRHKARGKHRIKRERKPMAGMKAVITQHGIPSSFYSDRGAHYWRTPKAGGKVDKRNPTQFGVAMRRLGIDMIAAYSPQARGRSERAFQTHQGRLPQELAQAKITTMKAANAYLKEVYMPEFNQKFSVLPAETQSAFVPLGTVDVNDILSEQYERTVGNDNCVAFEGLSLQIPADKHRHHYVRCKVTVRVSCEGKLSIQHGPRCLARYDREGLIRAEEAQAQ